MGKTSVIKSLGRRVGNIVLHKLLVKYTHRSESRGHLQSEEIAYRDSAIKEAKEYNWNKEDYLKLKEIAIKFIKDKGTNKYPDVSFPLKEAETLVIEEVEGLKL